MKALGDRTSTLVALYYFASLISVPFWIWVAQRLGKHKALCFAMFFFLIGTLLNVVLIAPGDFTGFALVMMMSGVGFGPVFFIIPAMIADITDLDNIAQGAPRSATYYAVGSMAFKIAFAAGFGIVLPLLEWFGYHPGRSSTEAGLHALAFAYDFVPLLCFGAVVALAWGFQLDRAAQSKLREKIEQRDQKVAG